MGFDAEWLTLREPADAGARDPSLLARAVKHAGATATVLDLGCGTGATARAFQSVGASEIRWRFFDNDPQLLACAADRHPQAEMCRGNLAVIDRLPIAGVSLVTASALLDLVSRDWLGRFVARLAKENVALYAALSYDGVMRWTPDDPEDAGITECFNRHQRSDKGFGPALGPNATVCAAEILIAHGYDVSIAPSFWRLGGEQTELQLALLGGIAQAAGEMGHGATEGWFRRREQRLGQGLVEIGHSDLLALPPGQAGDARHG